MASGSGQGSSRSSSSSSSSGSSSSSSSSYSSYYYYAVASTETLKGSLGACQACHLLAPLGAAWHLRPIQGAG